MSDPHATCHVLDLISCAVFRKHSRMTAVEQQELAAASGAGSCANLCTKRACRMGDELNLDVVQA